MDAIADHTTAPIFDSIREQHVDPVAFLRQQMRADALQPPAAIENGEPIVTKVIPSANLYSSETIEEAVHFLRLNVRLSRLNILTT